ncbi:MAG: cation transporter [Gammaproteobacteria bacterium]|nr:cation transporter [Gammaproteobacteria bacterium]
MPGCSHCVDDGHVSGDHVFRRVLWAALLVNGAMFGIEIVASFIGDSVSLQADALDFLADSANYAISLFVVGMAISARARATLVKGATMAVFGCWVIGSAIYRAVTGSAPDAGVMGGIAFLALTANVAVAALLYRFRQGDSNMRSIWLCSRNDAVGNVAVILAAAGVFASSSRWPDLIVAAVIAGLNISAAAHVVRLARGELADAGRHGHVQRPAIDASAG